MKQFARRELHISPEVETSNKLLHCKIDIFCSTAMVVLSSVTWGFRL